MVTRVQQHGACTSEASASESLLAWDRARPGDEDWSGRPRRTDGQPSFDLDLDLDLKRMSTPRVELLRLGSRIRIARTALGYNQRGFAAACGLNRTYFGGVERGERNVTFSVLCMICVTLGCDVAALTEGIPDLALAPC